MSVDLLSLISEFRPFDDRENANAYFKTSVPWVAPEAYLNIVYKPAPEKLLSEVAERLSVPSVVVDFLRRQNGALLFSSSLNMYGVVEPEISRLARIGGGIGRKSVNGCIQRQRRVYTPAPG